MSCIIRFINNLLNLIMEIIIMMKYGLIYIIKYLIYWVKVKVFMGVSWMLKVNSFKLVWEEVSWR